MIFAKKNKNKYIKLAGAAAVLLAAASAMVWFTGCALTGQTENPADSAVSVSQTTNGKEDPYKRFDAVVKQVDGNIKKIEIGRKDDREPSEYVLQDKYVYYLYRETKEYILKRFNTADPSDCGMVHIYCETDFFCSLSECALRIEKNDEVVFMDLDLNTICTVPNIEQYESIFPYKDSYVVMKGADLLIVRDGKLEPFGKLDRANYAIMTQQVTPDNTRLVLCDNNENGPFNFFIYDVKTGRYEQISEMGFSYYDDGFYDYTPLKIKIRDISKDKPVEIENSYPGTIGRACFNGEKMYISDSSDMMIRSYDPFKKIICTLTDSPFGTFPVNILGVSGNKLYFVYIDDLYSVDMTGREEMPLEEFKIRLHGERDDLEREVRDKYSVNLLTGDAAAKHILNNVKCTSFDQETRILYALKQIEPYIKRFGKAFFDEFRYGTSKGLYVLMTGYTEVTNDGAKIDAGGVAFRQGDIFYIILNISSDASGRNFCHELMHSMEQNSDQDKFFPDWQKYNPKGFKYADSYAKSSGTQYSLDGPDGYEVYFFDTYSKTNAMEDRARVFEHIVAVNKDENRFNDNPRLKAKALYIKERICKLYPSLKDSDIFMNLEG